MTKKAAAKPKPAANVRAPGQLTQIPLAWIEPSKDNPRRHFDEDALAELAASIKVHGVIEPIIVRPVDGKVACYELIAGERRWRASKLAKQPTINAIIRADVDDTVEDLRLVENDQRQDLTACERADAYRRMVDGGRTIADLAKALGKSERTVEQQLSLAKLGPGARIVVDAGVVDTTVAVRAASIPDAELQAEFLHAVAERHLTFRQAEELLGRDYQRSLSKASFSTKDATLLPEAGACSKCPHNTTNMARVDGQAKVAKNVCTHLACWRRKQDAHWDRMQTEASGQGLKLLTPKEQEETFPSHAGYDHISSYRSEFVDLDSLLASKEYSGNTSVEIRKLVDEADYAGETYIGRYQSGKVARLVPRSVASKLFDKARRSLRADGAKKRAGDPGAVSAETLRKREQTDARKAAHEAWAELDAQLADPMTGDPEIADVLALAVQHIAMSRANNREDRAALLRFLPIHEDERAKLDVDRWSEAGKKADALFREIVVEQVPHVDSFVLARALLSWIVRAENKGVEDLGFYGGSKEKGPWFRMDAVAVAGYRLWDIDLEAKFARVRGERAAAEAEVVAKAKAKKAGAARAASPKRAKPTKHAVKAAQAAAALDAMKTQQCRVCTCFDDIRCYACFDTSGRERATPVFVEPDLCSDCRDQLTPEQLAEFTAKRAAVRAVKNELYRWLDGQDLDKELWAVKAKSSTAEVAADSPLPDKAVAPPDEDTPAEAADETPIANVCVADPLAAGKQALEEKLAEAAPTKAATPAQIALLADLSKGRECYVAHDTKKGWQAWWAGTDTVLPKRTVMPAMDAEWVRPEKGDDPTYSFLAITDAGRDALAAARS